MVSRLRPLDVTVSFQDRTYRLGESIELTIEMTAHRDCHVREGRVDLVVEERWTERTSLSFEKPVYARTGGGGYTRMVQVGTTTETRDTTKDHKETSVHSSAVFIEDARLESGRPTRHSLRLEARAEAPARGGEAKIRWWVQTVVDVAGARDIKPRSKVTIAAI